MNSSNPPTQAINIWDIWEVAASKGQTIVILPNGQLYLCESAEGLAQFALEQLQGILREAKEPTDPVNFPFVDNSKPH